MNLAEKLHHLKVAPGESAVCWLGQAGFFLKDSQGKDLVIDPYLTNCGRRRTCPLITISSRIRISITSITTRFPL